MDSIVTQSEIITNVATNLVEDSVKNAWTKIKQYFKDLEAKDAIRYKTAYENYLHNTREKNSQIKTIIYRRAPKELYSFYECVGIRYNHKNFDANKITNLFPIGNKVIITGSGGSGKSILFKHLFLNTIDETSFIPVLIELRSFNIRDNKEISIYDGLYKTLVDNGFELSEKYFEYSMKAGAYVIFFDGYDEVNRDKTEAITSEIKAIAEKYNNNKYFISSRPLDEFIGWNDFREAETLRLSKKQALNLINKIEFDNTVKQTFCKELQDYLYEKYESFASNPLLLNIMLLTFQKHAVIPERLNDFYEEAFVTLFNAHDATKDAYVRDIRSGLGCEEFKLIFSYICFKSYFSGEFEFSESKLLGYITKAKSKLQTNKFETSEYKADLTQSVCMLVKEGRVYRFTHRSFQEYFAAWYTCKLTDNIQSKLLLNWIKESESIMMDAYFQMLFNLQSDKVNKIVLCPIISEIKKIFSQYGFSMEFIEELFDRVTVRETLRENDKQFSVSLGIKNNYYCKGIILSTRLNRFNFGGNEDQEAAKNVYKKIKSFFKDNAKHAEGPFYELQIDELLSIVSEKDFLKSISWFEKEIKFAFEILNRYENENISRKKKVASILEEL